MSNLEAQAQSYYLPTQPWKVTQIFYNSEDRVNTQSTTGWKPNDFLSLGQRPEDIEQHTQLRPVRTKVETRWVENKILKQIFDQNALEYLAFGENFIGDRLRSENQKKRYFLLHSAHLIVTLRLDASKLLTFGKSKEKVFSFVFRSLNRNFVP